MFKPFIKENVWEVKQWPLEGPNFNIHQINDIYYYDSINSNMELKKQSTYIQIPESLIGNKEGVRIVIDNLEEIISNNIPVIQRITDENWIVNLTYFRGECG
jgi:hypothetical protein